MNEDLLLLASCSELLIQKRHPQSHQPPPQVTLGRCEGLTVGRCQVISSLSWCPNFDWYRQHRERLTLVMHIMHPIPFIVDRHAVIATIKLVNFSAA
ncbi:unnamed protein product [Protopolystoma xenopodis]|uniref:Uncharacterized protein n=1 Tax=Protopolystoma xenopodis TaxID=117903 RepID=A0A448WGW0_9PLAT|nr:unnamed protein product [Protopolystoma xenopodis]